MRDDPSIAKAIVDSITFYTQQEYAEEVGEQCFRIINALPRSACDERYYNDMFHTPECGTVQRDRSAELDDIDLAYSESDASEAHYLVSDQDEIEQEDKW
jgi:hypothetical protein